MRGSKAVCRELKHHTHNGERSLSLRWPQLIGFPEYMALPPAHP